MTAKNKRTVSFVDEHHISVDLSSDKALRSSREIEATHVSAMLYLASNSYLSIH